MNKLFSSSGARAGSAESMFGARLASPRGVTDADRTRARASFLLIVGPFVGMSLPLPERGAVFVGGDRSADLSISDPLLSPRHALLRLQPSAVLIEDLASTTGTWLGDTRLPARRRAVWDSGVAVLVGCTVLVLLNRRVAVRQSTVQSHRLPLEDELGRRLREALEGAFWNQTRAAEALGLQRNKLIRLMKRYNIAGSRPLRRGGDE